MINDSRIAITDCLQKCNPPILQSTHASTMNISVGSSCKSNERCPTHVTSLKNCMSNPLPNPTYIEGTNISLRFHMHSSIPTVYNVK